MANEGTAPCIPGIGTRREVSGQLHASTALPPREIAPGIHRIGG